MILYYSEKANVFYAAKHIVYALSLFGSSKVKENVGKLIKTEKKVMTNTKDVFDFFLSSIILGSHYVENTLLYQNYSLIMDQYEKNHPLEKNREPDYYQEYENKLNQFLLERLSSFLVNAKIEEESYFYSLPYTFDGKELGIKRIKTTLFVEEHGVMKTIEMNPTELPQLIENDQFIRIHFNCDEKAIDGIKLEMPTLTIKNDQSEIKKRFSFSDYLIAITDSLAKSNILKNKA